MFPAEKVSPRYSDMTSTTGGLVPTPPNDSTKFLNGIGTFTVPSTVAQSATGIYSLRPSATTVTSGYIYYATDTQESYRSDGANWYVVSSGGIEIGYAELDTSFSTTSASLVNVLGLAFTATVGENPIMFECSGLVYSSVGSSLVNISMLIDGVSVASLPETFATSMYKARNRQIRISNLVAGTTHVFSMQVQSYSGGGTSTIYGTRIQPFYLRAVTA